MLNETKNAVPAIDEQPKKLIAGRLNTELERLHISKKAMSRKMLASENTLGNYTRGNVPDQWVYLQALHAEGVDIRYVLLDIDPDFAGLTAEENLLLNAYRQLSPHGQLAMLGLTKTYAQEVQHEQKNVLTNSNDQ